jgi:hypothetical protein
LQVARRLRCAPTAPETVATSTREPGKGVTTLKQESIRRALSRGLVLASRGHASSNEEHLNQAAVLGNGSAAEIQPAVARLGF